MKTPENYLNLLGDAGKISIPSGPDWNRRFREELSIRGLDLSLSIEDNEKHQYPDEHPYMAPWPTTELEDSWPRDSLIVWRKTKDVDDV